ncbi:MAG TPA: hypothetical protein VMW00_06055 [Dehalococcoidales bacterium]|nr:hypothetical protein [Dehalococcoidales bacterium]
MAFSDPGKGRIVEQGEGLVKVTLAEACKSGDILGYGSGWKRALATVGTAIQGRLVAGEDGDSAEVITAYRRAVVSGYSGGTAGNPVYVAEGTDNGKITETKPTTSGDCDTIIGYMVSAAVAALEPGSRADSTVT